MTLGFSPGRLAKGKFIEALRLLENYPRYTAVELSALRESELPGLIEAIPYLKLEKFHHVSIHAPSKLVSQTEDHVITLLLKAAEFKIPVIVHPDIMGDLNKWRILGSFLCIENMDKRKPIGRTAEDLARIFYYLPEARFCLDLAHAKQVDQSMVECANMIRLFRDRLVQFHISDVTSDSRHVPINNEAIESFRKIAGIIPMHLPFIIESPVTEDYIENEFLYVSSIFHINHNYINHTHPFVIDNPEFYVR